MTATANRQGASPVLWIGLVALGAFVLLFAFTTRNEPNLGGIADPDGVGPNGLRAARLFVEEADGSTRRNVGLPDEDIDVAILAGTFTEPLEPFGADETTVLSWQPLLDWVRAGGTLITTYDVPGGPRASSSFVDGDSGNLVVARGLCTIDTLDGVQEVRPLNYVPVQIENADSSCFGTGDTTLLAVTNFGDGQVVRVGTMALFYNRAFNKSDNAALFARLIEIDAEPTVGFLPVAPVWFILDEDADIEIDVPDNDASGNDAPPLELDADDNPIPFESGFPGLGGDGPVDEDGNPVGAGDQTLLELIDPTVLALIAGLFGAALLYAVTVGRRHGSPIAEPVPIELPSSSYVDAVGRLYRKAESANGRSASILRHDLRTELARRVGMSANASAEDIAKALVAGDQQQSVIHLLDGPPPADDDEFVALATQLIQTRDRVDRSGVATLAQSEDITLVSERTSR